MNKELAANTNLSHYRIERKIGAGGMGEVFLAEDDKLGRRVALKILSAEAVSDADNLRRFEQEARAASILNHPFIAHIYEIGESEGTHFIAMEYVEGESLADKIAKNPLPVSEIVQIGAQIADALSEAHARGIVHRDIKSANVMIDRRGRVKVLDFGLAKISADSESEADTRVKTAPGVVMGTVSYMSPEQAMGRETDARTDIWSLGVVLYEMATGRLPFDGASVTDTIDRITHAQPAAIARFNYEVPAELEVIIKKALRKKREERYASAKDLLVDLENLKREIEFGEHAAAPNLQGAAREISASEQAKTLTFKQTTDEAEPVHTTSSAEYIVTEIKRHKTAALVVSAVLLAAVAGAAYWFIQNRRGQSPQPARLPFQNRKVTRVATGGNVTDVVISPDAKYVAYAAENDRKYGLWLKQPTIATSNVQVVPPGEGEFRGIAFAPDSQFIYYSKNSPGTTSPVLYQVPALGGDSRKVISGVDSAISFSPDGKQIAFFRSNEAGDDKALFVANPDGSGERILADLPTIFQQSPAWSPDGKTIACVVNSRAGGEHSFVVTIDAATGEERRLTPANFGFVGKLAWLADGSGIIMRAIENSSEFYRQPLWFVAYPGGEARRLTGDLNNYQTVSLTKDSRTLATIIEENKSSIWLLPEADSKRARQISVNPNNRDGKDGLCWTPDEKLVFHSTASGQDAVWMMNPDGANRKQITDDSSANYMPKVSPDGRFIVFVSERGGGQHLWRMDADGSNPVQLSKGGAAMPGSFTPDGEWFVYEKYDTATPNIWKVPVRGGESVRLTDRRSTRPIVSPDGKFVACHYWLESGEAKVAYIPIEGGKPAKFLDIPQSSAINALFAGFLWTPDKRALTFRNGSADIWLLPLDGSPPKQLTDFKSETIFGYDWSPDGKTLAVSRGSLTKDVALISEAE